MGRRVKNNILSARWDKKEEDIIFFYPTSASGHLLHSIFCSERIYLDENLEAKFDKSFVDELEERGYDITTLRFSVERKE